MYIRHFSQDESLAVSHQNLALEKIVIDDEKDPSPPAPSLSQMAGDVRKSILRFLAFNPRQP